MLHVHRQYYQFLIDSLNKVAKMNIYIIRCYDLFCLRYTLYGSTVYDFSLILWYSFATVNPLTWTCVPCPLGQIRTRCIILSRRGLTTTVLMYKNKHYNGSRFVIIRRELFTKIYVYVVDIRSNRIFLIHFTSILYFISYISLSSICWGWIFCCI